MTSAMYAAAGLLLLKATVVLLFGWGASLALRNSSAAARHLVWVSVSVLLLSLPLLTALVPRMELLPALEPVAPLARSGDAARAPAVAPGERVASGVGLAGAAPIPAASDRPGLAISLPASAPALLLLLWGAGVVVLLGRLALSSWVLRRMLREAAEPVDPRWRGALWEAADRLGLADVPSLLVSDRVAIPFTGRLLRPVLVVPASSAEWTEARRRAVLFHELAHIRRRDLLSHTVARVACALYWVHPLAWMAARRLRAESERACDDLVLGVGTPPSEYADHLLHILRSVRAMGRLTPVVALPMARRGEFEGRMLAILDPALSRTSPGRAQALGVAATLLLATLPVAALAPRAEGGVAPAAGTAGSSTTPPGTTPSSRASPAGDPGDAPPMERAASGPRGVGTTAVPRADPAAGTQAVDPAILARLLAEEEDPEIRRTAAWGLAGRLDDPTPLTRALREDGDPRVREMVAWALAMGEPDPVSAAALARALAGDPAAPVRATAAWAIGILAVGGDVVRAALAAGVEDPDAAVRTRAAWAAGNVQDRALVPGLETRVRAETDPQARRALLRALLVWPSPTLTTAEALLASADPALRAQGARIAAGLGVNAEPWPWPDPRPDPGPADPDD